MARTHYARRRTTLALALTAAAAIPSPGWGWGGPTHHYIARNYSQHLPASIDGLRAYDAVVDQKVTDPDTRKASTPGEEFRHYLDIDDYPEFASGTLTHDRASLEAQYGAGLVLDRGVLPWAVGEVMTTLTQQFRGRQWSAAATTIADLCHYVGDATQPLHCTGNYDGQMTGNGGIHARYESVMMADHLGELHTSPATVTYYTNSVDTMFGIITASWTDVTPILEADDRALSASAGQYNATYYASLWTSTRELTRERIDAATLATASFVYTAWMNAGQPVVPGSSANPPLVASAPMLDVSPTPFRDFVTLRFAGTGPLSIDVYDLRGAHVDHIVDGAGGGGSAQWRPAGRARPGLYFVRLTGPGLNIVRRITRIE